MSTVIDFKTKVPMSDTPSTSAQLSKQILAELNADVDNIKDIIIFVKFTNDEMIVSHSGALLSDKCLAVQLLQNDIQNDINDMNELGV